MNVSEKMKQAVDKALLAHDLENRVPAVRDYRNLSFDPITKQIATLREALDYVNERLAFLKKERSKAKRKKK